MTWISNRARAICNFEVMPGIANWDLINTSEKLACSKRSYDQEQ